MNRFLLTSVSKLRHCQPAVAVAAPKTIIAWRTFCSASKDPVEQTSLFSKADEDYANRPGAWDDPDLGSLVHANRNWIRRKQRENPEYFDELKKGHAPKILWIGCVDARVPANEVINEPPGSVMVHRNIANMVNNIDTNGLSSIQFAVDVLKVKHIIVCGHYDCGGIRAALQPRDHQPPLENWLRNIRDVYRLHQDELDAIEDPLMRQRRLVQLNVVEQCINLFKTGVVQRRRNETFNLIGQKDKDGYVEEANSSSSSSNSSGSISSPMFSLC
jgi:carbonic anhydrase